MTKPKLTRNRIALAFAVAIVADILEFPITGAEATILGAPEGVAAAGVLDCIVMGIMTKILGFHWMFLPSFIVEILPGIDMFPTWVGCVGFVVWQRRREEKELAKLLSHNVEADIQNGTPSAAGRITPPPLPAFIDIPAQTTPTENDLEKRLSKLDGLRERGVITQAEYDAKRQQILSEI